MLDLLKKTSVLDVLVGERILNFTGYMSQLCFSEFTEILCLNEDLQEVYIPISQVKIGTLVKSYKHGYRKVSVIYKDKITNNINDFESCMFVMYKEKDMTKDLIVTGGHSILVDDMTEDEHNKNMKYFKNYVQKIENKVLLLAAASDKFKALENNNEYITYNFALENEGDNKARYGVWANGVLVETPSIQYLKEDLFGK